ncbi:MAG: hypothetical protein JRJ45_00230 [Deltaproteobacteria bacterium]|nr:hypothetical protein [Deltaproteobacteria bacterium]
MADDNLRTGVSPTEADNTASNPFYHVLSDGTNPLSVTGGVLDVNAVVTLETAYVDEVAWNLGSDKVNAQGFLVDEVSPDSAPEGSIALARMTADRIVITAAEQRGSWDIGTVTTLTGITNDVSIDDGGNSITVDGTVDVGTVTTLTGITNDVNIADGGNSITVDAIDLDIRALDHVTIGDSVRIGDGTEIMLVNANGSINTVPAVASSGSEVHDHDKSAATAKDATSNHDYTVANTTFLLSQVSIAGAGRQKVEVQVGPVASLVSKYVLFKEREATLPHEFIPAIPVPATGTGTVRLIRTQRSLGSLFMYSTISGEDI